MMGQESKFTQNLYDTARLHPKRVVFAEGTHPTMLEAAIRAKEEGICHPILLGNDVQIRRMATEMHLNLEGVQILNLREESQTKRAAAMPKSSPARSSAKATPSRKPSTKCTSATTSA